MSKTSQLDPLINVATNDLVQVVDVSDDTMAISGTNKKITVGDLATGIGTTGALQPTIPLGTSSQYYRGDKTWQTLNKSAVGLGNVTNESKATMFTNPTFTGTVTLPAGAITNADINDSAAIALSKLATGALPTAITVASANIVDGTIVNDDISASAAIDSSKLANVTATGSTTARSLANRFADVVNVKDFGVVGDGVTDDTNAVKAAIARADSIGGASVYFPSGLKILIDSDDIVLPQSVSLFGDSFSPGTYEQGSQAKIILNPLYTIRVGSIGCSIKGLFIRRKGLVRATSPSQAVTVANDMSGTGITVYSPLSKGNTAAPYTRSGTIVTVTSTNHGLSNGTSVRIFADSTDKNLFGDKVITVVNSNTFTFITASTGATSGTLNWQQAFLTDDVYIGHCFIAGFNQAIKLDTCGRYMIEHIYGDNRNGIWTRECYDVGRIQNCHFWPWYTVGSGGTNRRAGIGFFIDDVNDSSSVIQCFCGNYDIGFKVAGSYVRLVSCVVDGNLANLAADSKGFWITDGITRDNTIATQLTGCVSIAHQYSYYYDSSNSNSFHSMVDCSAWSTATNHIKVVSGTLYATACNFYNTTTQAAVRTEDDITRVRIDGCSFQDVGNVYSLSSGSIYKTSISSNNSYLGSCNGLDDFTSKTIIRGSSSSASRHSFYNIGGGGGPMTFYFKAEGDNNVISATPSSVTLGGITSGGYDGTQFLRSGVIRFLSSGTISTNIIPTACIISTTNSSGSLADRVFVDTSGNLQPFTDNAYTLGGSGFRWSSVWSANGTIQTSDERTKTDIEDSALGLDFIGSLHPVSYKFKVGGNKVIRQVYRDSEGNEVDANADDATPAEIITEGIEGQRTHFGLIAQEVKAALPAGTDFGGWILTDKDDPDSEQGLRYEQFIAPLIKAVQELKARVEELENA